MIYKEKPEPRAEKYNFFNFEHRVEDLLTRYKKFKTIIVAVDFDETISPLYEDDSRDFTPVHELIKRCKALGFKIVIYTARNEREFYIVTEFCNQNGIEYDAINKDVIDLRLPTSGKIYYNVFLDDKAGLMEAFLILKRAVEIIEEGIKNKKEPIGT